MTSRTRQDSDELALAALRSANFDPVAQVQSVWDSPTITVEELHQEEREKILTAFANSIKLQSHKPLKYPVNPQIAVYTGVGGAGKTQLLGQIQKAVIAAGSQFLLVDLTGVNHFQPTVCLHLIQSLLQTMPDGNSQLKHVLAKLFQTVAKTESEPEALHQLSSEADRNLEALIEKLSSGLQHLLAALPTALNKDSRKHVLRAMMMLGLLTGDERADAAHDWLQGGEIDEALAKEIGLPRKASVAHIISAATWFMGFRAPTLLAFDQLDVIVHQFDIASRGGDGETAAAAKAVVTEMAGGLAGLWEHVHRTQILVSCLSETWKILKGNMLVPVMDRFGTPLVLAEINSRETSKRIIELRLSEAFQSVGFEPPYPTWPFRESFFQHGLTPRSLLLKCAAHLDHCFRVGEISEASGEDTGGGPKLPRPPLGEIDEAYAALLKSVSVDSLKHDSDEADEALGELLELICTLLLIESPPPPHILGEVHPAATSSNKSKVGIHTRLILTIISQNEREELFCMRALQRSHATAFQARLKAAITDSGLDTALPFRRLVILRNQSVPNGAQTKKLVEALESRQGRILPVSEDELRTVLALKSLSDKADPRFHAWLVDRKPLSKSGFVREAFKDYYEIVEAQEASSSSKSQPETRVSPPPSAPSPTPSSSILLGKQQSPLGERPIELPLAALTRHVLIRAGSGGGKTVLLKRLIESAALAGVPSIVLDPGNDLAFLGDSWPTAPSGWLADDPAWAARYHKQVQVVVWTPGRSTGRPLAFSPLPDFKAVLDDPDDFEAAVVMAAGSLSDATGASKGANSALKIGLLTEAIRHFARQGGQNLPDLVAFLRELPQEAQAGISKASKLGQDMADTLKGTLLGSRVLMPESGGSDVSELLGLGQSKTRISVVSLAGLSETNGDQLAFVNQLAVVLFTWIRQNPAKQAGQVRGLLVVDEARDFVPSVRSTPCKDSLMRVAAQARKYGFGLMLATQNPTDIDHKIAGQCATQFFGRAASPNVVDAMRAAIAERGGNASDLTQLGKGQFYFCSTESQKQPIRIQAPICLSHHPDGRTLSESEILIRARKNL